MELSLGDTIHGRDETLGTVQRFLIDPTTATVQHIVVDPGVLQDERIVPLEQIRSLSDGTIGVDISRDELKHLELYHEDVFPADYRHDSGPPAYGNDAANRA